MKYEEINKYLLSLGNPKITEHPQCFFKAGEGEYDFEDKFLGIRGPILRETVKEFNTVPLIVVTKLLRSEYHKIRLFAPFTPLRRKINFVKHCRFQNYYSTILRT